MEGKKVVKTNILIFKRDEDEKLSEKPDQNLRCRGAPIIGAGNSRPLFDINNDGVVDTADLLSGDAASGHAFDEGLPAESNFLSENQYTPGSTGNLEQGRVDTGSDTAEGRMSWREILE